MKRRLVKLLRIGVSLMGERGNIAVEQWNGQSVYLYTHWTGYNTGGIVQRALKKGWRWDDPSYLARIIFEELIKGYEGEETGFGISTSENDKNYPTVYVDCKGQKIRIAEYEWSFKEFCELPEFSVFLNTG